MVIQCRTGPWPHWRTPTTTDALRSSPQSSVSSSILHLEDLASRLFDVALKFTLLPSNSFFSKKTRFPSVTNVVKNTTGTKNQVQESHDELTGSLPELLVTPASSTVLVSRHARLRGTQRLVETRMDLYSRPIHDVVKRKTTQPLI